MNFLFVCNKGKVKCTINSDRSLQTAIDYSHIVLDYHDLAG